MMAFLKKICVESAELKKTVYFVMENKNDNNRSRKQFFISI